MHAVSNTSPVSNLAHIRRLPLLRQQFERLWIPLAVAQELSNHPDPNARDALASAIAEGWIETRPARDSALLRMLLLHLHPGEAEAIALAADLAAHVVLIDEREGRQYASQAGIAVTGVLGILLRARKSGTLASLKPDIHALRSKGRFFVSQSLEARVLAETGE